jgi:hypothetical protein
MVGTCFYIYWFWHWFVIITGGVAQVYRIFVLLGVYKFICLTILI